MTGIGRAASEAVLTLAATTALIGPVWWRRHRRGWADAGASMGPGNLEVVTRTQPTVLPLAVAAAMFLLYALVLHVPAVGPFTDLAWNWQGKLLAFGLGLLLVSRWNGLGWRELGFVLPPRRAWLGVVAITFGLLAVTMLVGIAMYVLGAPVVETGTDDLTRGAVTEALLFQALVPGLDEELLFRGILWVLVARALPGPWTLWGAPVGWALIVTTVLFGFSHGVHLDEHFAVSLDVPMLLITSFVGFWLGWVRARWGSILPAIVLHNLYNVGITLLSST